MGSYVRGAFCSYMSRFAVSKGMEHTHTSIIKPSGSFYVSPDDFDDFMKHYTAAFLAGEDLYMTEKHRDIAPFLIDLDFRFDKEMVKQRMYTIDMIETVISLYTKQITDYLEITESYELYLMEKSGPVTDKKYLKDGIHIVIPAIVTKPSVQHIIRQNLLKEIGTVLAPLDLKNPIEDVVDEAVIEKNNWQMYGSKKPNGEPYKVSRVYRVSPDGSLSIVSDPVSQIEDLPELFSIRNKYDAIKTRDSKIEEVKQFEEKKKKAQPIDTNRPMFKQNLLKNTCENLEWVGKIVDILKAERADSYDTWIRTGWCLRNIDHRLMDKWIEFSKRSTKYTDGECEKYWNMMRDDGLSIGTLCMWAKQDNPDAFRELMEQDLHALIINSKTETHYDIAKVVQFMFKYDYVCVSNKNNMWYEFKNHRWVPCDGAYTLRAHISIDVVREYQKAIGKINILAASGPQDNDSQDRNAELTKKLNNIVLKLKQSPFKDNIIKECRELFYIEKFEERLDSKCHLIGYENGVYDLEALEFREGRPDDYISMTTRINYVPYEHDHPAQRGIEGFVSTIFTKPHIRDYVLKLMGSFLNGSVREEKFHIWTGSGCFSKGTPIMMSDGSSKTVERVMVGDQLMGDDSTPRTVLQLFRGYSDMYDIIPAYGDKFTVNGEHDLVVKACDMVSIHIDLSGTTYEVVYVEYTDDINKLQVYREYFDTRSEATVFVDSLKRSDKKMVKQNDIIVLTVHQYLRLAEYIQDRLVLYRPLQVQYKSRKVEGDPYKIGFGCDDIRIPSSYKYNSKEVRLQVLAGMIDRAGSYNAQLNHYEIPATILSAKDIVEISRSLGYACYRYEDGKLRINGRKLYEIPCRLSTTRALLTIENQDYSVVSFKVERVEDDHFYGFELDGNRRFLLGDGDLTVVKNSNGKSALINLFEMGFGDYCCKFPVTLLTMKRATSNAPTPEIARSKGRRFAVLQEPSEDEKMNVGLMKELTGGDKIIARQLHKDPIEFKPQFKMVLTCNHLPNVPSDDGGTWRRIRVVEFTSRFCENPDPEKPNEFPMDKDLPVKFEEWKEHFMSLLIEYYKRYMTEGVKEPDEVLKCTRDYQRSNDVMMDFYEQEIEKVPGDDRSTVTLSDIFTRFQTWMKDNAPQLKNGINKKTLKGALEKHLKFQRVNGVELFKECRLRNGNLYDIADDALDV